MSSRHKILFVGRDSIFKATVLKDVDFNEWNVTSVWSSAKAKNLIETTLYDILMIDEAIFTDELLNGHQSSSISELTETHSRVHNENGFILFFEKKTTHIRSLKKTNKSSAFFSRSISSSERVSSAIKIMRREMFYPVMIQDLKIGKKSPFDFYFNDQELVNQKIYLKKNQIVKKEILALVEKKGLNHLYLKKEDLKLFFDTDSINLPQTNRVYNLRENVRGLLLDLLDDSGVPGIANGKKLFGEAESIIKDLSELISSLKKPLENLPYPRLTLLNHAVNTAIYSLWLGNQLITDEKNHVGIAALVHDISLEDTHHEECQFEESASLESIKAEDHVQSTLSILRGKNFLISKIVQESIDFHHENIFEQGYPHGKSPNPKKIFLQVLALANEIDHLRSVNKGQFAKSLKKSVEKIVEFNNKTPRFSKDLIDSLKY